jgi:hypothetical protein
VTEEWREIEGFGGRYEVSDQGRVRSWVRGKPEVLRQHIHPLGYPVVTLYLSPLRKTIMVHKLVLRAFLGPRPDGLEGCHNNGVRVDNRLVNLRYDTHQSNMDDQFAHGTHRKGERNGKSKLTEADLSTIRARRAAGETYASIAKDYGVSLQSIHHVITGKTWSHT